MYTERSLAARRIWIAVAVFCGVIMSDPSPLEAQTVMPDAQETVMAEYWDADAKTSWGTTDRVSAPVSAFAFQQYGGTQHLQTIDGTSLRYLPNGGLVMAPLALPTGARVEAIELGGCDESTAGEMTFQLFEGHDNGSVRDLSPGFGTGITNTACGAFFKTLPTAHGVNNFFNHYFVGIVLPAGDGFSVATMRIYYNLQVSPPPGSATFSDVPTGHPFFQHVEALAASGITSGCGGNRFCPGAPLTRGQMAVFLAKALGLHWPN